MEGIPPGIWRNISGEGEGIEIPRTGAQAQVSKVGDPGSEKAGECPVEGNAQGAAEEIKDQVEELKGAAGDEDLVDLIEEGIALANQQRSQSHQAGRALAGPGERTQGTQSEQAEQGILEKMRNFAEGVIFEPWQKGRDGTGNRLGGGSRLGSGLRRNNRGVDRAIGIGIGGEEPDDSHPEEQRQPAPEKSLDRHSDFRWNFLQGGGSFETPKVAQVEDFAELERRKGRGSPFQSGPTGWAT